MAHLELDPRLLSPPGVLALEEVAEELLLEQHAIVRVEVRPVLDPVDLEPLLSRRRAREALEVAARMQTLPSPVGRGEERHLDLRPVGHARAPVLVAGQRVLDAVLVEVATVGAELFFGERRRPGYRAAVHTRAIASRAQAVLN